MDTKNPIIVALDVANLAEAQRLVDVLEPHVGGFKVGLELFIGEGMLPQTKLPVILDLKLHDIPNTVEKAILAAGEWNRPPAAMTMHAQQRETLTRAGAASDKTGIHLFVVTLLTSMGKPDMVDLGFKEAGGYPREFLERGEQDASDLDEIAAKDRVRNLAQLACQNGLTSFVCSPKEVGMLRKFSPSGKLLVPGIRPAGSASGDQRRTSTPKAAVDAGADFIVIGRPITEAKNPAMAALEIVESLR